MARLSRRRFVKWAGLVMAGAVPWWPLQAATMQDQTDTGGLLPETGKDRDYGFFDADDAAFIEAAVERLIPADEDGPGAFHVGVSYYIDRQLCSPWGSGQRRTRSDAWLSWLPAREAVLAQSPAAFFRMALRGIEADLAHQPEVQALRIRHEPTDFDGRPTLSARLPPSTREAGIVEPLSARRLYAYLPADEQALYLQLLKHGYRNIGATPSQLFFETLLSMTIEGFFNAPVYTGNEEAVA